MNLLTKYCHRKYLNAVLHISFNPKTHPYSSSVDRILLMEKSCAHFYEEWSLEICVQQMSECAELGGWGCQSLGYLFIRDSSVLSTI